MLQEASTILIAGLCLVIMAIVVIMGIRSSLRETLTRPRPDTTGTPEPWFSEKDKRKQLDDERDEEHGR